MDLVMPTVALLDEIKINMYFDDHAPPHIHAIYAEHEVLLIIDNASVYSGSMPGKQLKKVQEYMLNPANSKRLRKLWKQYNGA